MSNQGQGPTAPCHRSAATRLVQHVRLRRAVEVLDVLVGVHVLHAEQVGGDNLSRSGHFISQTSATSLVPPKPRHAGPCRSTRKARTVVAFIEGVLSVSLLGK